MKKYMAKAPLVAILAIFALLCLLPFYLTLIGSFTSDKYIRTHGFSLYPAEIDFTAYKILAMRASTILRGYLVSIIILVVGTPLSLLVNSMIAYTISQKRVKYRNAIAFISYFTIMFNGGMVPWYIICVNLLGLRNNILGLIVPYLANAIYVVFFVNYFRSLPQELCESAFIDGAGELRIFFRIIMPVSTPVIATVGLFAGLEYWNDWWLGIMLIDDSKLQPLQILLRTIVSNIQFLNNAAGSGSTVLTSLKAAMPTEGIKMATCIVTVGPIIFLYPFVQRYFIKGIMIGAIKG